MTQATNDYAQAQAATATASGTITGTVYHNRPALLCVPRDRTARPRWPTLVPLAGGGFEWRREVVLLDRRGEVKARATGWAITWINDAQRPEVPAENAALVSLARPGDLLGITCWTAERGTWVEVYIVASRPGARLHLRQGDAPDQLEVARYSRPWRAAALRRDRAAVRAFTLAEVKAAALAKGRAEGRRGGAARLGAGPTPMPPRGQSGGPDAARAPGPGAT